MVTSNQYNNQMATTSTARTNQYNSNAHQISQYSVSNQITHYSSGSNQISQLSGARSNQLSHSNNSGGGSSHIVVETGATRGIKRERADIDFEAFSDAKRKKPNEKGSKGNMERFKGLF